MMNRTLYILLLILSVCFQANAQEKIILLNEGNWQADNGRMTYFENGSVVSNQWFRDKNGMKLGDTPNDIIQVNDNLIAIAMNWSNIIQFITPEGKAVAATEDVPNNRRLASDGNYVYVTSYGHECGTVSGMKYFEKGFVAKIDVNTFQVVDAVEVGYEPEGIALYNGRLFVANSGGYAFQEGHDYESTVNIINAKTMQIEKTIDTGCINLYGGMAQSGKFLLINSAGDYYENAACSVLMDCDKAINGDECFRVMDIVATYCTTDRNGKFLVVGSDYSYLSGGYELNYCTISPAKAFADGTADQSLPGSVGSDIKAMSMPYAIYVNPYTGYIYATDAASFAEAGAMYQWDAEGKLLGKHKVYINPGHFLALPPDGHFAGIEEIQNAEFKMQNYYNLNGQKLSAPAKGVNIINGKKYILK